MTTHVVAPPTRTRKWAAVLTGGLASLVTYGSVVLVMGVVVALTARGGLEPEDHRGHATPSDIAEEVFWFLVLIVLPLVLSLVAVWAVHRRASSLLTAAAALWALAGATLVGYAAFWLAS